MFKMLCLQFLYDLSDWEVEEQATFNLLDKWFLGLSAEERPPDHTTLCRFRARLGAEGFQTLSNDLVALVTNLKRLVKLILERTGPLRPAWAA